jgi:serine protease Do
MRGEVIGINTAIVRGGSGIGFAIPASMARRISTELVASGKVTRGWLGVSLQPLTPELAASFGVKDGKGALVSEVVPDSPAARAGLRAGDVVIEINGRKVDHPADLARTVGLASPGDDARIKVWRDQRERTIEVKLRESPGERPVALTPSGAPSVAASVYPLMSLKRRSIGAAAVSCGRPERAIVRASFVGPVGVLAS